MPRIKLKYFLLYLLGYFPSSTKYFIFRKKNVIENFFYDNFVYKKIDMQCPGSQKTLLSQAEFKIENIILCNDALSSGGVERQIVNTINGFKKIENKCLNLLCLNLYRGEKYRFYEKDLQNFRGIIRDITDEKSAYFFLKKAKISQKDLNKIIGWMPLDVQREVVRFIVEFMVLKPSIVHAWQDSISISAAYAALIVGVPRVIISTRNIAPINFAYYRSYMKHAYIELLKSNKIIFTNNSMAGAISYSKWLNVAVSKFHIVKNGIDENSFNKPTLSEIEDLRREISAQSNNRVVGSIFRFNYEKRPFLWLNIARSLLKKDASLRFVIYGEGPLKDSFERKVRQMNLQQHIFTPGLIINPLLALSAMDLFLLTSDAEGTPNALLEALLVGIPIVATNAGGVSEVLEDSFAGIIVNEDSSEIIAERVMSVLNDLTFYDRSKNKNREFIIKNFGFQRMISETRYLYDHITF